MLSLRRTVSVLLALSVSAPAASAAAAEPDGPTSLPAVGITSSALPGAASDRDQDRDAEDARAARREKALGAAPFVTVLTARAAPTTAETLPDLLSTGAGVRVQSIGGLGQFSSVSIRGSSAGEVAVYLDGVPLTRDATAGVDLSSIGLDTLERVEIYRGAVPAALGDVGMGGAVNLVTRIPRGTRSEVAAGAGSFGYRKLDLLQSYAAGDAAVEVAAAYSGATGDFSYYDDNGTPLNPSDDFWATRRNNDYDALDLSTRAVWDEGDRRVDLTARSHLEAQGIPGFATEPATATRLDTVNDLVQLHGARRGLWGGRLDASGALWGLGEWQHYDDPEAQIALLRENQQYATQAGGGNASLVLAATDDQLVTIAPDLRVERFRSASLLPPPPPGSLAPASVSGGERLAAGLAVRDEILLGDGDLSLAPELRLDAVDTRPPSGMTAPLGAPPAAGARAYASPRAGLRWLLTPDLALKANAGRTLRLPTFYELYGDRGFLAGNPALVPEVGLQGDVGLAYDAARPIGPFEDLAADASLFASDAQNLIELVSVTAREAQARNFAAAHIAGAELSLTARTAHTEAGLAYTRLRTRQVGGLPDDDGKQLPGRPADDLSARAALRGRVWGARIELGADASYLAGTYLDAANLAPLPPRLLFGATLVLQPARPRGLTVTLTVRNLLDARVEQVPAYGAGRPGPLVPAAISDFIGYPLPGRAAYLVCDYRI